MGEIVNLRMVKKQRARVEAAARAAENRARFGRTKAEKRAEAKAGQRAAAAVDGARLDPSDPGKAGG